MDATPPSVCRVLVVDDRAELRRLLVLLLEDEPDFTVIGEAANGREALERTVELRPDLVLLDHDMPVMSGMEALERMPRGPAVVLVSSAADELEERALALGAAAAIPKATGVLSLVERLREVRAGWSERSVIRLGDAQRSQQDAKA